ncbi:MAG: hypothetical protein ACTSWY_05340, partial [Promethearchaeota archaeon]
SPIVGAKIEFRENSSSIYTLIGDETTDINGNVTFRWLNYSASITQIDFRCYYNIMTDPKKINITYVTPEDLNISVDFESISYYDVGVELEPYETNFTMYDLTADHTYGNNLSFRGIYNFTYGNEIYPINYSTVNYRVQYHGDTLIENTYTESADTNGIYNFNITYSDYSSYLTVGFTYALRIKISKEGKTPMWETLNFEFIPINTSLILNASSVTKYWSKNMSVMVHYNDTYNGGIAIDGASVTYSVVEDSDINGTLVAVGGGTGNYSLELNTTIFASTDTYTIQITAINQNYETQTEQFIIKIEDITTTLVAEEDIIEVYWLENFTLNVRFNDSLIEQGINDATVTWTVVESTQINDVLGRDMSKGNGWYTAEINTTRLNKAGPFSIRVGATRDNYDYQEIYIYITINKLYTLLNGSTTKTSSIDVFCLESYYVYFNYSYRIGPEGTTEYEIIRDATYATYEWEYDDDPSQSGLGSLEYNSNTGFYKFDFQTEIRPLGTYSINILLEEHNYVPRLAVVVFHIENRTTSLSTPSNYIELYEGQPDYQIAFTYKDTVPDTDTVIPLASSSYIWTRYQNSTQINPQNTGSGTLTYIPVSENYILDFSPSVQVKGFYVLDVTLDKLNYTSQSMEIILIITKLPANTTLTAYPDSDSIYWKEFIQLYVIYNNTDTDPDSHVLDAIVTYSVNGYEYINGSLVDEGSGNYSLKLNSTVFPSTGEYTLSIMAEKQYYNSSSTTFLIVINDLYTKINGSLTLIEKIDIYRTEHEYYYFNYSVRVGNVGSTVYNLIWNATFATFEWEYRENETKFGSINKSGSTEQSGIGTLIFDANTGLYVLDFQTETRPIGTYIITVRLQEYNHLIRIAIITLNVNPKKFDPNFEGDGVGEGQILKRSKIQGNKVVLTITLLDWLDNSALKEVTVLWITDSETLNFVQIEDGVYEIEISTGNVNAFFQQQVITGEINISAVDYEDYTVSTQITVRMPEIFEGMPTFYFVLIIGFCAVFIISLTGYKAVQYARIPLMVKKIRSTKKSIRKKSRFKNIKINRSADEILEEESEKEYALLGLSLKGKLTGKFGKGGKDATSSYEDIGDEGIVEEKSGEKESSEEKGIEKENVKEGINEEKISKEENNEEKIKEIDEEKRLN